MFSFKPLFSATIISTATGGSWSSASTWVGGIVPTSTDDVVIASGATVTLSDNNLSVASIVINGALTVAQNIFFTVNGNVTVNNGDSFSMASGGSGQTLIVKGDFYNYGSTNFNQADVIIVGDFISPSSSQLQNQGNLVIGGNASGYIDQKGGNQVYTINPNATITLTLNKNETPLTTVPSNLISLVNQYIYGSACGFSINGPSNSSSCAGSSAAFTIVSTTANSPSYQWEENRGSGWSVLSTVSSTLTISGVTPAMNGYNYRCKVTDASSCSKFSFSATLTVTVSPTAIAGGPDNVCQSSSPQALTLNGASVGGSATTGAWSIISGGGTLSATAQTSSPSTITYTPAANYNGSVTLRLSSNSTNGCPIATADRSITVNPLVTPAITISASNNSICSGVSVNFTASATNGGVSPSYQWKINGTNVGTNSSSYSYTPNNNDVVTCVLTSNASCTTINQATSNSITMVVNSVPTKPASFISSSASVSQGQTGVTYSISAISNAISYNWSYSGTGATINGSSSSITLDYSASATSGTLSVYATNSCGVSAALTMGITVNPFSAGSIGSDQTICSGNYPSNLTSLSDASPAASTYQWQSSPDASTWTTISGATNNTYSFLSTLTQTTYYRRIATYNSCSGYSNNVTITVNPVPTASFTASGVAAYECLGNSLTLTGSYTPSGGTGVTYNWYKPGNSVAVQSGSSNIFNYSPSLNISDSGDYGLIVVRNGCTSSQTTVTITVRNPPSPQVYRIANR